MSNRSVLFGPYCELALAPVARQLKFHSVPLVTGGGLSFDYGLSKVNPEEEFYLLTRTGWDFK